MALARGNPDAAVLHLREAINGFDDAHMELHGAAARARLGALVSGDEGRVLLQQARSWMSAEGIADPPRLVAMLLPGAEPG